MKKVFVFLTAAILCFGLLSCGNLLIKDDAGWSWGGGSNPNVVSGKLIRDGKILQDGEDSKVVMDNSLRWWKLTEPVRVEKNNATTANGSLAEVKDNQIRITSYSLYAIKNVDVYGDGTKLFTIANLPALAEQVYELPNGEKNTDYTNYSVKSSDAHYKKLVSIRNDWTCSWKRESHTSIWVEKTYPLDARAWIAFVTNLAFLYSSNEFQVLLDNFEKITHGKFVYNNGKPNDGAGTVDQSKVVEWTLAKNSTERNQLEDDIFCTHTFNLGILGTNSPTEKVVSGQTYRRSRNFGEVGVMPSNFSAEVFGGPALGIHEFGHAMGNSGYGHASSFSLDDTTVDYQGSLPANTIYKGSFKSYASGLGATLERFNKAPYCDPDLVGYYKKTHDNFSRPDFNTIGMSYLNSKVERENVWYHKGVVSRHPLIGTYSGNIAGKDTSPTALSGGNTFSGSYINCFEASIYHYKNLYPELHSLLQPYYAKAKAEGFDFDKYKP